MFEFSYLMIWKRSENKDNSYLNNSVFFLAYMLLSLQEHQLISAEVLGYVKRYLTLLCY